MAKFNEYTQKATPEDADTLMIYDAAAKANKLLPFSGIWNWIVGKLTNAVISNLQTSNKSVIGALNELNSNQAITITSVKTSILKTEIALAKAGNIVVISYTGDTTDNVKQGDLQVIGTIPPDYVPRQKIAIAPIQSTTQRIQLAFENNGNITAYNYGNKITTQTACRYNGCYVC